MVSWTCRRALLNWRTLRSGGVFWLRGAAAISQQARAAQGLLGKMPSRSILEGAAVARCSHGAFPGCRPWRYLAVVCFRVVGHGKISPRCVPGRRSVAAFSLHAFPRGPRMGKAPVCGNISPPCIRNELASARYARHASEKPCKRAFGDAPREDLARKGPFSLRAPLKSCTARRSCHSWVLRLSVLVSLGRGGGGARGSRTAPRFVRVARLFRGLAHMRLRAALRLRTRCSRCRAPCVRSPAPCPRCWVCLPRRPRAASSRPQPCRRVRVATELAVACRLPQKTWRCDGVSLNYRCSAVLF